ncbi:MAG: hypothetical protein AAB697_03185 [Patescibacteria group bacterium]
MNTQRITISMPDYLYTQLLAAVPTGQISKFVSAATEDKIVSRRLAQNPNPIEHFLSLGGTLKATPRQIRNAISRGRL